MTDELKNSKNSAAEPRTRGLIDRRKLFHGAAALTVSGLSAPAALAQTAAAPAAGDGAAALTAQTNRVLRWAGRAPADWVRARGGTDHNVVIVGGGQSGVSIAHQLALAGVGRVQVIDQSEPGQAGIWRNIARMHQLRTPKTLAPGPEAGNVALGFRAWFETLNGAGAFDALDRIPRLTWADYLAWFQQATGTDVRYRTRLIEVEPQGDALRLQIEEGGVRRVETTRKLVLANGYAGAGGANLPAFVRALPANVWTHTTGRIPLEALKGKVVGVIGAGSNAFDAAGVVLEAGAAEVHLFNRRAEVAYQGTPAQAAQTSSPQPVPAVDRGTPNVRELAYELPDVVRWRNFLAGERRPASVPLDSLERAVAFDNFHIHLNTSLEDVSVAGSGKLAARAGRSRMRLDYLVSATGYRIDLAAQPELARIQQSIALWGDRYKPAAGEENRAGAAHPYLGAGFEFLPREGTGAEFLRNIHCFNLAAMLSFGVPVGDVPSMADHPRLVAAIAKDLYLESVDVAAHERFINAPAPPADPSPYEKSVAGRARSAA